ncbi:hypothetical protein IF1G_05892 [Cordyceps javanica]|uniref:Uncharacterized protein n=1 Tax=Cordyceps javanica TaxID=43265 RepID=A0A545UZK3_9HYPO|nr:hypothetical protein IF1G_05892 [Cordyceps javanica]
MQLENLKTKCSPGSCYSGSDRKHNNDAISNLVFPAPLGQASERATPSPSQKSPQKKDNNNNEG